MGWTMREYRTPEQLLASWRDQGHDILASHCCFEGDGQVLWTVERSKDLASDLLLICTLLRDCGGGLGIKDMTESMHPFFYSCPLEFLAMTEDSSKRCDLWREGVAAWHSGHLAQWKQQKMARCPHA